MRGRGSVGSSQFLGQKQGQASSIRSSAPAKGRLSADVVARFEGKIDRSGPCWLWTGGTYRTGYGRIKIAGRYEAAHRVALELAGGSSLTPEIHVCHRCDTPLCVRPAHLFLGTRAANMRDMTRKGRQAKRRKLTDASARAIKIRLAAGERAAALAREYGITSSTLFALRTGITWKHVGAA